MLPNVCHASWGCSKTMIDQAQVNVTAKYGAMLCSFSNVFNAVLWTDCHCLAVAFHIL
jgi:hypothetical protein